MKLILRGFYSVVSNLYWQNQCGVGQREPLEAIWTNISAWAVHIEMVDQGYDLAYEYFWSRRNPHNLSVGPMPVLGHLPSKKKRKKVSWCSDRAYCVSVCICSCPRAEYCWKEPGSVFAFSVLMFVDIDKIYVLIVLTLSASPCMRGAPILQTS